MLGVAVFALLFVSAGIAFALASVAWTRGNVPGSKTYTVYVTAQGLWALCYGLELVSPTSELTYLFDVFVTIWSVSSAFLWLVFVLEYTGRHEWVTPRRLALLWSQPIGYLTLYVTNPRHGIVHDGYAVVDVAGGLSHLSISGGPVMYAQILIIYLVLVVGFALLGSFMMQSRNLYRRQTGAIFFGGLIVVAGNLIWIVTGSQAGGIDLTPIFFIANGFIVGWALLRYDFLNLAPLASNTLIEEMVDPVIVVDEKRRLVDFNDRASTVFELDDALLGEPVNDRLTAVIDGSEADRPIRVDGGSTTPNAGQTVYQPNCTKLRDHHDLVRGELIVLRDITTQKRREENLQALQAGTRELIEAETRTDVAAVTVEKATSILDYPFAGLLLYDGNHDALVPASLSDPLELKRTDAESGIDHGVVWETYHAGESTIIDRSQIEERPQSSLPVERALLYPLGDHGILCIGMDRARTFTDDGIRFIEILALTAKTALDRAQREEELEAQRAELKERNDHLDEFANIVSHDLRNPLNAASGYLDLARSDPNEDYFDKIETAHDRMERLVDDVLSLARQGAEVVDPAPVAIEPIAQAAWDTAGSDRGSLVVHDFTIEADADRLQTVFENLFRNAIEHGTTSRSGPHSSEDDTNHDDATVTVTISPAPNGASFAVEDDGPGIAADDRETIFEHGYTTDRDGTGFGLSIVDRIASVHGWTVSIEDSDFGGARFVFEDVRLDRTAETQQ